MVAFSTPGVKNCLGWHLGEFMALGKAIISLPLTRSMPSPVNHAEHVHFVDGSKEEIAAAIQTIQQNRDYRNRLETNARKYFETYLSPGRVIEHLLQNIAVQPWKH